MTCLEARRPRDRVADIEKKVRIDKWLWAARFFKTRSLAKAAIEGGKVELEGSRVKVSKEITLGDRLMVRRGWDEIELWSVVLAIGVRAHRSQSLTGDRVKCFRRARASAQGRRVFSQTPATP